MDHVLAGVIFPSLLLFVALVFRLLRGHQGLGLGDVKLSAGIGLWVGLDGVILVLLGSASAALFTLVVLSVWRGGGLRAMRNSGIAFGPFLCLFTWVAWLKGLGA